MSDIREVTKILQSRHFVVDRTKTFKLLADITF